MTYVLLARAPRSRWIAVLVPLAAWTTWWLLASHTTRGRGEHSLSQVSSSSCSTASPRPFGASCSTIVCSPSSSGSRSSWSLCWRLAPGSSSLPQRDRVDGCTRRLVGRCGVLTRSVRRRRRRPVRPHRLDVPRARVPPDAPDAPDDPPTDRSAGRARRSASRSPSSWSSLNHGAIFDNQQGLARAFRQVRINTIIGNLDPAVVPDDVPLQLGGRATVSAREYRRLVAEYGAPPGSRAKRRRRVDRRAR